VYQNDLKSQKNINLKQIKKFQFFSKTLLKRKNNQGIDFNIGSSFIPHVYLT